MVKRIAYVGLDVHKEAAERRRSARSLWSSALQCPRYPPRSTRPTRLSVGGGQGPYQKKEAGEVKTCTDLRGSCGLLQQTS